MGEQNTIKISQGDIETFKAHGKLITVHSRKIAINALQDEEQARKIVEWLKREINDAWERRDQIVPSFQGMPRPQLIEILKLLPKTNCMKCGQPTCIVFASLAVVRSGSAPHWRSSKMAAAMRVLMSPQMNNA